MLVLYNSIVHHPSSALPHPARGDEVTGALSGLPPVLFCSVCWGHLSSCLSGLPRTVTEMTDGKTQFGFTMPVTSKMLAGTL